jgi:hypothetical protein
LRTRAYLVEIHGTEQVVTMSPCVAEDFQEYWEQAKAEKLVDSLGTLKNMSYFILRNAQKQTLGFCGIQFYSHKAIFKNDFIVPEYRRNGLWNVMYVYREAITKARSISAIEATCTAMSINLYLKRGHEVVQRLKTLTKVRKSL